MKATGIVRRIDDLGRVVVPKEIRRTLRIREGDPLEIFTDRDGQIILKKYSPIGELGAFSREYSETLSQTSGHAVYIIDRDQVVAIAGASKKEFLNKRISDELEDAITLRNPFGASKPDSAFVSILEEDDDPSYSHMFVAPIISEGDVIGAVIMTSPDKKMGEVESKLSICAAAFLGKQMED